jgi:hypothetical protein
MQRLTRTPEWPLRTLRLCAAALILGPAALHPAALGPAQPQPESGQAGVPQRTGSLIVWIVSPQNDPLPLPPPGANAAPAWPPQYQEQTASSFGKTAGSVGQTAGSAGQSPGSVGSSAGSVGQTAGSAGQTAGSFGKTAGSVGQNAGDIGQSIGTFGTSTGEIAQVAAAKNGLVPLPKGPHRDPHWAAEVGPISTAVPKTEVTFLDVYSNDLKPLLEAAAGTPDAPDLLLGSPLPQVWSQPSGLAQRFGVASLWHAPRIPQTEDLLLPLGGFYPVMAVLKSSPNPQGARAMAEWFADRGSIVGRPAPTAQTAPIAQLAVRAELALLAGGSLGADADPEVAAFNSDLAASRLIATRPDSPEKLVLRAEVSALRVFGNLAFVAVRAVGSSPDTLGVAHAVLVMRRDPQARWRVLQASPDLEPSAQTLAWNTLVNYSTGDRRSGAEGSPVMRNEGSRLLGVVQAAPIDGDSRPPQPELWWDNLGGAVLQVVEWQQGAARNWPISNLYFVPDNRERLRTRVVARFALTGQYRWRVWSLGPGGIVVLSPWRTMTIVGG